MRALPLLLALAALAAPAALGQPEVLDWVSVEIAPFAGPVKPLQGPVTTPVTTRASCLLAESAGGRIVVTYAIPEQPRWATVVISPSTDAADVQTCEDGSVTFEATLIVTTSDQAPAFSPAALVVEATVGSAERQQAERASVNLSAAYFAIFDVTAAEFRTTIAPGASHAFPLKVTNFGNGPTRVEPTLVRQTDNLSFTLPSPVTLGSKQQGSNDVSADLVLRVEAPAESGFVNRVATLDVRFVAAYATDDSQGADETLLSFLVTVRSAAAGAAKALPATPLGALLALALAAVAGRARRQ